MPSSETSLVVQHLRALLDHIEANATSIATNLKNGIEEVPYTAIELPFYMQHRPTGKREITIIWTEEIDI